MVNHLLTQLRGRLAASLCKIADMLEVRRDQLQYTNDSIGRNLKQSDALRDIRLAIASTLDVRGILNTLIDKLDSTFPKAATTIQLLNKHTGHLEGAACHNLDESSWRTTESKISQSGQSAVASAQGPILIEDCRSDPRIHNRDFIAHNQLVSYMGIPLLFQNELVGALGVFTREKRRFKPEEIEFLAALGSQAAIAIHNAWL